MTCLGAFYFDATRLDRNLCERSPEIPIVVKAAEAANKYCVVNVNHMGNGFGSSWVEHPGAASFGHSTN